MSVLRARAHDHYLKVSYTSGRKEYYPVVTDQGKRSIRKHIIFKRASDAEEWALRFERKLARLRASTPVRLPFRAKVLLWFRSLLVALRRRLAYG